MLSIDDGRQCGDECLIFEQCVNGPFTVRVLNLFITVAHFYFEIFHGPLFKVLFEVVMIKRVALPTHL